MKRMVFLITMLFGALAIAQSTATLDGGYIANVYGQSNFVKNPNAQKNVANVTTTQTSTITRSTTTPLMAGTEFNIADSGAWNAIWSTRALDAGMKNQNCEAKIKLRGAASGTTTFSAIQNSVTIATLTVVLDATNPKTYSLYFPCGDLTYATTLSLAGSAAITQTIEAGAVYFGGQVTVSSGTISTEPLTYTPVLNSNTNIARNFAKWQRVGPDAIISGEIAWNGTGAASALTITVPAGLSIDTSRLPSTVNNRIGDFTWNGSTLVQGEVYYTISGGSVIYFAVQGASGAFVTSSAGNLHVITYNIRVPITGWSATDVVTPEANLVEYASNSSATDANDTTSFVNGPAGAVGIIGTTNISAARAKRVRFSSPIKATDSITLEIYDSISTSWMPIAQNRNGSLSYVKQNTTEYGMFLLGINSTDIDVYFLQYAIPSGATYGAAGTTWDSGAVGAKQWRVKKDPSIGNQSFYIQGPTKAAESGSTLATGYVGEKIAATVASSGSITTSEADISGASMTLGAGVWRVFYSLSIQCVPGGTAGNYTDATVKLTDNSNNLIGSSARSLRCLTSGTSADNLIASLSTEEIVYPTTGTTYKLRSIITNGSGTGSGAYFNTGTLMSTFHAIRIN